MQKCGVVGAQLCGAQWSSSRAAGGEQSERFRDDPPAALRGFVTTLRGLVTLIRGFVTKVQKSRRAS